MGNSTFRVAEPDPLNGLVLGAEVDCVLLPGVGAGEDVSDVVEAVDLVESTEGGRAPDRYEGVAGAGDQEGSGVGFEGVGSGGGRVGVGGGGGRVGEEEPEDMALVCLDAADELEGGQRPDEEFSIVCASEDVSIRDGEGEDGAVVLELLDPLGGV